MEHVIVERWFDEPVDFADVRAVAERYGWCLELHGVRFLRSYLSADGRRMVCVYEAPDAEAVRLVNRQEGLPVERVWTAAIHEASE